MYINNNTIVQKYFMPKIEWFYNKWQDRKLESKLEFPKKVRVMQTLGRGEGGMWAVGRQAHTAAPATYAWERTQEEEEGRENVHSIGTNSFLPFQAVGTFPTSVSSLD